MKLTVWHQSSWDNSYSRFIKETHGFANNLQIWDTLPKRDLKSLEIVVFTTYKMARVYTKIDYSPAWELNEKVIDYIFFSNKEPDNNEDSANSFERMSKYNLVRGEAFISGECVYVIEDSGFTNVEQVISKLLSTLPEVIVRPTKVQIKIINIDKKQAQLYQRILR